MDETTVIDPATPAPAPAPEAPAPAADPAAHAAPAEPLSRRDFIAKELAKQPTERGKHAAFQPRQDQGKFLPGAPQFPRPEMPKSLKAELRAHWETAPVELVTAFHQRELDSQKGVDLLKKQHGELQTRAQHADELLSEFKPYEMLLRMENSTPKQAISSLMQTAAILRTGTPAQKAQSVAQVMQQFGIPLEHVQQMLGGNGQQPALDPQYNQIAQKLQTLEHNWTQQQQLQQQQSEARALAAIQQFAANPEHVHFDAVQDRMLQLLQAPQVLGDTASMTDQDKLKLAYDTAIRLDPALSAQVVTAQQAAEKAKQQVTQAKNAAVQVKGAPPSGPAPAINPKDRRAIIVNAMRHTNR